MSGETATSEEQVEHRAATDGIQLMQGESVLENRQASWTLWWKQIALAIVVLLAGLASGSEGIIGGVVVAGAIFGYVVYSRAESRYIVTDERIKGKIGILSKTEMEYRIADLRSIASSQSVIERLVGHGTVSFRAGANNELVWHGVPDYKEVTNTVRERQRAYE